MKGINAAASREALVDRAAAALLRLARLLTAVGWPSREVESRLVRAGQRLGFAVEVAAGPTSLLLEVHRGQASRTRVARLHPGGLDLGRMIALDELLDRRSQLGTLERGLGAIEIQTAEGSPIYRALAMGLAAVALMLLLGSSDAMILVALIAGVGAGSTWELLQGRVAGGLAEALTAMVSAMLAIACGAALGVDGQLAAVAGIVVMLPGYSLTLAFSELGHGELVSGTARTISALASLVLFALGIGLGAALVPRPETLVTLDTLALQSWPTAAAAFIACLAFIVLLAARSRDALGVVAIGQVALLAQSFSPVEGVAATALAALLVGLCARLWGLYFGLPAAVLETPGLFLLVPGVLALTSLQSASGGLTELGVSSAITAALSVAALFCGTLIARVIPLPDLKTYRSRGPQRRIPGSIR